MNLKFSITSLFMAIALLVSAGCTTENGDDNESSHVANQQVSLSFYQVTMQSLENSQAKTRADESSTSTALKDSPFTGYFPDSYQWHGQNYRFQTGEG